MTERLFDRRHLHVLTLAFLLLVAAGCCCHKPKPPTPPPAARIRPAVSTISGDKLEAYRKGVAAMKALPVTDPRSWLYQASMHGFFDQATTNDPDYVPYAVPFVAHAQTNNTWAQCQHFTDAFLVWHRIYLVYFERIMREVSGQPDLMLPYWDYTFGVAAGRTVPPAFRDPTYIPGGSTTPVANPLYAPRLAALNAGTAGLDPLDVVFEDDLQKTQFFGGVDGFSNGVEGTPHGDVHVATQDPSSGGVMMGLFETAAQDPIFWLHHGNIDRLWDCWNRRGNANPASITAPGPFPFIDENGAVVSLTTAQLLSMAGAPDYTYDTYSDCDAVPKAVMMAAAPSPMPSPSFVELTAAAQPLPLSSRPARVKLKLPEAAIESLKSALATPAGRVVLALEDIKAAADPGVIYRVYLVRAAKAGAPERKALVGSFTFFGRVAVPGSGRVAHHAAPFSVELDATPAWVEIADGGEKPPRELTVSIEPASGVTGDTATTLDERFNLRSQPVVRAIELRLQSSPR